MMPLIGGLGGNKGLHRILSRIVDIAGDLNAKFSAYARKPEEIMPEIGERFNPAIHVSDDPLDGLRGVATGRVMLTIMGWRKVPHARAANPDLVQSVCTTLAEIE
jgi:hypothetical protein